MKARTKWKIEFEVLEEIDMPPTEEVKNELKLTIEEVKAEMAEEIGLNDMRAAGNLVSDSIDVEVSFEE